MAYAVFGPGSIYITRTDVANSTPVNVGFAQEFSYDEAAENKSLYGQNQYPLVTARGTVKATGKMKAAEVSGIALNSAMWGNSFVSGQLKLAQNEAFTASSNTYTPINSGTFDTDLGVLYSTTGLPLGKVASGPIKGQYAISAGTIVLSASDSGAALLATYAYTTTGTGQTLVVTNQAIGVNPTFQLDYSTTLQGSAYYIRFYSCIAAKLTRAHKLTDFMMPEIDFDFFANSAGNVYKVSFADQG